MSQSLIARMDALRSHWVDLPGGKRVQFRRPFETDLGKFAGGVSVEHVCECACDWAGFTEADLVGAAFGSDAPVKFTPELWAHVVRDRIAYVQPVAEAVVKAITEHLAEMGAAAKN
jgi:hypothetical protein